MLNIKKYFKKQLDSKKQSDTTLQVFVIFLIFLDFTKWKPKLIHDFFFLNLFEGIKAIG